MAAIKRPLATSGDVASFGFVKSLKNEGACKRRHAYCTGFVKVDRPVERAGFVDPCGCAVRYMSNWINSDTQSRADKH